MSFRFPSIHLLPGSSPALWGGLACVIFTGVCFGISLPLMAFAIQAMNYSPFIIGLNTAMSALSAFLCAPLYVRFMSRCGLSVFISLCTLFAFLSFIMFFSWKNIFFLFAIRFLFGACLDGLFVAVETWVGELASEENRGKITGIFSSCLSIGYLIGSGLLAFVGSAGLLAIVLGSGFLLANFIPLFLCSKSMPHVQVSEKIRILQVVWASPIAMSAAFIYGFLETSAFNLLPIHAIHAGLSERLAVSLLPAVSLGQACLQIFIGILADYIGVLRSLFVCSFVSLASGVGILFFPSLPFIHPLVFIWGATISGFYTLALILVGRKYNGTGFLTAANSAIVSLFALGSLVGPPVAGFAMSLNPVSGFPLSSLLPVVVGVVIFTFFAARLPSSRSHA